MDRFVEEVVAESGPYSMLPEERLRETVSYMVDLARSPAFPSGSVVECGMWRGGTALALTRVFGTVRRYALHDSFAGLPPPGPRDGEDAHHWAANPDHPRNFDNCRADYGEVAALLEALRPNHDIVVRRGWFEDTLRPSDYAPVAFAHLDCDWYDATWLCLERLWPHLAVGAAVVIDDYYDWEGCRRAVHDFLSRNSAREAIDRIGRTGGAVLRRLGRWDLAESPHLQ